MTRSQLPFSFLHVILSMFLFVSLFGRSDGFVRIITPSAKALGLPVRRLSVRVSNLSLASKKSPSSPSSPSPQSSGGMEPKYLYALLVFIGACFFDYFRMHGGIAPWEKGGFL